MLKNRMDKFPVLKGELEKLKAQENTYRYLIDYITSGHKDPSRKDIIEQIREALHRANEFLLRESRMIDSSDLYSSSRRMEILRKNTINSHLDIFREAYISDLQNQGSVISSRQEEALNNLFIYVLTMSGVEAWEYEQLNKALEDEFFPEYLKLSIISALTIGAIQYFDADFFDILLNQYENSNSSSIRARALVGVLLLSLLHSSRLKGNLELKSRLLLSANDEELQKIIPQVIINFVKTYDTQRIDNKMRNEVIPELMKIQPEIIEKMRNFTSDSENFLSDANPDWEEIIENSGVGDKLQEINEMQLEGADVMVTAFSNLKGFPFFSNISNWFLPFTPGYYELNSLNLEEDSDALERLTFLMCDSDIYSFLLSVKSMPGERGKQMLENMQLQLKEAREAMQNSVGESDSDIFYRKVRNSLKDLYRFYKFFRKKQDFNDPFGQPFMANDIAPVIESWGLSSDLIRLIAEFYFQKKYYKEAAGMYELYDSLSPQEISVWEHIGFCYDKIRDYAQAVKWYKKAEIINSDNLWLIKKLALALKNNAEFRQAIPYYEKALEKEPENYHLLMSYAECLIADEDYSSALKPLYHAQYLKPDKLGVSRAIAWSELLKGNIDKAIGIYVNLINSGSAGDMDYLNLAHSYLALKDFKNAIEYYKKFIDLSNQPIVKTLIMAFRDDAKALKKLNVPTEDLRIVIDKIRYDREN